MQHSQVAPEPHDVDFLSGCNISRGTGSTGGNATRCIVALSLSQLATPLVPPRPAPSHIARRCISSNNELLQQPPVTSCVPPFHSRYSVDHDWALQTAGWIQGSCSAFSEDFMDVFNPVEIAESWPGSADYVRTFVPELRKVVRLQERSTFSESERVGLRCC